MIDNSSKEQINEIFFSYNLEKGVDYICNDKFRVLSQGGLKFYNY